ncbi:uncharacterized protein LOC131161750 [Malania oleifera]|uniref:uncharacterized protein LOC131161750 n=1 Tax=Malania oleifera TaxID=397392 RepID=UPI0025AE5F7E|nr:uncharacterized protein LOC131161750 [Malania oleifera]
MAKELSKILANVLEDTISLSQSAFIGDRQILDAALIADEGVEDAVQRKKRGLVLKLDFEKAYDRLIKGEAKSWFCASRGLRQGDPLSPFLFAIVVDVFSKMVEIGVDKKVGGGDKGICSKFGILQNGWDAKVGTNITNSIPWKFVSQIYDYFLLKAQYSAANGH